MELHPKLISIRLNILSPLQEKKMARKIIKLPLLTKEARIRRKTRRIRTGNEVIMNIIRFCVIKLMMKINSYARFSAVYV